MALSIIDYICVYLWFGVECLWQVLPGCICPYDPNWEEEGDVRRLPNTNFCPPTLSLYSQAHLSRTKMWTNTLCNFDKYILQFGQIHFAIQTVARYNFCPDTVFQFCLHLSRTVKHIWVGPKNIALSSKQCQINCLQYFIGLSQFVERFLKCSNWKYFRYPAATIVIHHELQGAKFPLKNDAAASFNWSNVKLWYLNPEVFY